ncbi:MAG: acyl-CoA dehydrogenase family protein [Thermoflexales bacterium]|nr:acyl-CoA dehydrogenase family protein [Thermoflexales bacterium]
MDFNLTEEQRGFRGMFRDFAQKDVAKLAEHMDKDERLSPDLLKKAAAQGLLGAIVPEELGGAALDPLSYAFMLEELGRVCLSTALTLAHHTSLVTRAVLDCGDEGQKERWLPRLAEGAAIGAFALTEPDAGSDASLVSTRAVHDGGEYVLDGVKSWVTNAALPGLVVVIARTSADAASGLSAFVLEKDAPGLKLGQRELTLGLRAAGIHTMYLDGVRVPEDGRLGAEGDGQRIAARALDHFRLALAAAALGLAEAAVEAGVSFAAERVQFGGPIAHKQAIQNYIADSSTQVEALRYLVYHTAWQAGQGDGFGAAAVYAKLFAARTARLVTNLMVQVHGGYGYMEDYPIARMYRNARALELLGGTDELMRVAIAADLFKSQNVQISP